MGIWDFLYVKSQIKNGTEICFQRQEKITYTYSKSNNQTVISKSQILGSGKSFSHVLKIWHFDPSNKNLPRVTVQIHKKLAFWQNNSQVRPTERVTRIG